MKKGLIPGVQWIGELEGYSRKMAMVKVDLSHPQLAPFSLTQDDFVNKRKKFYSTLDLQKLWGFSKSTAIHRRFHDNEKLKIGRLWKFSVDIANDKKSPEQDRRFTTVNDKRRHSVVQLEHENLRVVW